ncbi:hypothetical protein [Colwellia echini]|uniref:Uncharacterized protein n=1 Tax=Colwellia echini TaxID=1982103 RepID=A0ABY3MZ55_9GAMM|nr:hypothetical protein [Colwellia echini]TYK66484.1 hypothetical protein CWS31_005945 [Colwellia echini]
MPNNKPPDILKKTWLDIYYSQQKPENNQAQCVVESRVLANFQSVYEAEMYLYQEEQKVVH